MDRPKEAERELHRELRSFYNTSADYWASERAANEEITPERAHLLSWIESGSRVLDVGCGTCRNAEFLGDRVRYTGCDLSHLALTIAVDTLPPGSVTAVQGESHALPFRDGSFDVAMSTYALEHFVYPGASLAEMWRVCRPGGKVIVISPAYDDPFLLPPSTTHWRSAERALLIARQAWRQAVRHVRPDRFYFARVERPRLFVDGYSSDFDAVHLVSAREVANYFRHLGGRILFERHRVPSERGTGSRGVRTRLRDGLLGLGIGQYARLNLQIVVGKPESAARAG